jgi:vesicle transport protein SEC22
MSQKYKKDARYLNLKSSYVKIAAIVIIIVLFLLFLRYWMF